MRSITVVVGLLALVLGLGVVARGEDGAQDQVGRLEKQVELLEAQVAYLRAREDALTTYLLASEGRSNALSQDLARSRREGFTMAAISSTSREALLSGLEGYAAAVGADLPALTKEQAELLRRIKNLERQR